MFFLRTEKNVIIKLQDQLLKPFSKSFLTFRAYLCLCPWKSLAFWTIPACNESFSPSLFLPGYCDMLATMKSNPLTFKYRDMELLKRDAIILFQHTTSWSYLLGLYMIVIVSFQMHQFLLPALLWFKNETSAKFWCMISHSFHSLKEHVCLCSNLAEVHPLPIWFPSFTWTLEASQHPWGKTLIGMKRKLQEQVSQSQGCFRGQWIRAHWQWMPWDMCCLGIMSASANKTKLFWISGYSEFPVSLRKKTC